jgi:UPF0176 protein
MQFINAAAYRFMPLQDLNLLQARVKTELKKYNIFGTLIIAPEGWNANFCATPDNWAALLQEWASWPEFLSVDWKISYSEKIPFWSTKVRKKKEIIAFGESITPESIMGERLDPKELKSWLDRGEDVVLLDTRNDYEIEKGTFRGAIDFKLERFRDFPTHLRSKQEELKDKKVVMFCTGGIRCEKATALAVKIGLKEVYQLEGGILRYFENVGKDHYDGSCFVFDDREVIETLKAT